MNLMIQATQSTRSSSSSAIVLNVLGGLLTVAVVELARYLLKRYRHLKFRTVLGRGVCALKLTLGKFVPAGGALLNFKTPLNYGITAREVGSFCEVRGLSYIAKSIAQNSSIAAEVIAA